jgi:protein-S-isoprenylcysteine O-methyltransferase Ste14
MSLIPPFELGLWNAWIFIPPVMIIYIFAIRTLGSRAGEYSSLTEKEKILFRIYMVIIIASYTYAVFLPLKLGTIWFYIGLLVYSLAIIIGITAIVNFATTPEDEIVTKGIYRISRNPMYVGEVLIYTGIGIACVSWIFLLTAIVAAIFCYHSILSEEHFCLSKYGNAYREYMNKTPRWIGIPK